MPNELVDLRIEEVSAVDLAANKRTWLVVKRAAEEEAPMPQDVCVEVPQVVIHVSTPDVESFRASRDQLMHEASGALRRAQAKNGAEEPVVAGRDSGEIPKPDGLWKRLMNRIGKQLEEELAEAPQAVADTFAQELLERRMDDVYECLYDYCGALRDAVTGILVSTEANKSGLIQQALADFGQAVEREMDEWLGGGVAKAGKKISASRLAQLKQTHELLGKIISEGEGTPVDTTQKAAWPAEAVAEIETLTKAVADIKAELAAKRVALVVKGHMVGDGEQWHVMEEESGAAVSTHETREACAVALADYNGLVKSAGEDIWKGVHPAVRQRLEKAETALAIQTELTKRHEYIQKAAIYKRLPIKADDAYGHFQLLDTLPTETRDFFLKQLEVGEAALKYSFTAQGTNATDTGIGTALAMIETQAQDMVAKGVTKTKAQAIAKIAKDNPKLVADAQAEHRAQATNGH